MGRRWHAADTGPRGSWVTALAIDPRTPTTLYAGTFGDGVFESTYAEGTWHAVNTGLSNLDVWAVAIAPSTPTTLYAGTGGAGAFAIPFVLPSTPGPFVKSASVSRQGSARWPGTSIESPLAINPGGTVPRPATGTASLTRAA